MSVRTIKWLVFVASIWILSTIDDINAGIVETPVDTEVRVGDSTYLNCSISNESGEVSWFHYPVGTGVHDLRYVYANKQVFEPYNRRYRIEKSLSTGSFNLVITQAEVQDAGSYVCEDGRKSATAHLIILESTPDCRININSSGFIGPNVCGLQKETIQLSCSINYTGNIAPLLQWTRLKQGNWFAVPESSCSDFDGRITCNYTTEADTQLDESVFICQSNRSRNPKDNCKTETVKILYAFATDNQMEKTVGETVTCVANTNAICWKYTWFYSEGDQYSVVSRSQSLSLENVGWYRCEANCSIKSQPCSYNTMTVNVDTEPEFSRHYVAIALLSCCVVALIVIVLILFLYNRKFKKYRPIIESVRNMVSLLNNQESTSNNESAKPSEEKEPWPKRHGRINPFNEYLLKCGSDPLIYINKPKLMHKFKMKANGNEDKAILGIAVLKGMLYVVRKDCKEIEVFSLTGYRCEESIQVENLLCPYNIISHDVKNYLFIDDNKDDKNDPDEIIRITPKEDEGKKCRWLIKGKNELRIEIGQLSVTPDGNILIPLLYKSRLREYDCDGNLKREIKILTLYTANVHIRQAILLRSGYFVLSFGDGGDWEKQGVFIAKLLEDQKLKCIQDDTSLNKDNKTERSEPQVKLSLPSHKVTLDGECIQDESHSEAQMKLSIPAVPPINEDERDTSSELKIRLPSHTITLDDLSILVADRNNRRVLLFHVVKATSEAEEPRLKFKRELLTKKNGLNRPFGLYLDKTSGCLFVADNEEIEAEEQKEEGNGRILVYSVI